jgi:hypothetical protein
MSNPLRLAELIAARAFHDMGGLAGTLSATLELAAQEVQRPGENLRAAVEAAGDLGRRVDLLRAAWGPLEGPLAVARLPELAHAASGGHRLRVDISALPARLRLSPALGRVTLNLLLLAVDALPRGGALSFAPEDRQGLIATLRGPRAAWPEGFAAMRADEQAAWAALGDARQLLGPLLAITARTLGIRPSLLPVSGRRAGPPPLRLDAA